MTNAVFIKLDAVETKKPILGLADGCTPDGLTIGGN